MGDNVRFNTPVYETLGTDLFKSLQVNDLSFALLSFLLLPLMVDTAKKFDTSPRVVTVASEVHYWTTFSERMLESHNSIEFMSSEENSTPQ